MIFATYSITDDRKQKVSFGGPYFIAGQDLLVKADNTDITGPDSLNGKKLCSVTGSTSAKKIKDKYASGVQLQEFDTYSKCVEALSTGVDRRRDHRQRDPGRLRRAAAVPGQAQGRRQAVLRGAVRRRHQEGRHRPVRKINAALEKMVSDGSWEKALTTPSARPASSPTATNPPKPDACS